LTESKVGTQLARLITARMLPDRSMWQISGAFQLCKRVAGKCKDAQILARQWPLICRTQGRALGNPASDCCAYVSWMLLGAISEEVMQEEVRAHTQEQAIRRGL
jgi:hypothetical protein